jgi:iron complex outermembrane receptor protein
MSNSQSIRGRQPVRWAVATAVGTATLWSFGPPGSAAEAEGEVEELVELEEVQITGSRITRRDQVANSPLVTVEAEQLEQRAGLNVESYLNQLPNFNPAATPVTTQGDVQITPVNSVGISSISLRGFGPNRNLVLVDGRRLVPANALMVTDVSAIPSALIQSVETISGGASAVYGADAIGGVTNFILKRNFQGFEVDAQTNMAEAGDGEEMRAYALLGTNFAEGRGNATFGLETYNRKAAYERNRSFYTDSWSDPTVGGDFFVFGYNGFNSAFTFNAPNRATLNAIFADRPTYTTGPAAGQQTGVRAFTDAANLGIFEGFRFNTDGSVFATGGGNNLWKYLEGGGTIDNYEYAIQQAYDNTIGVGADQTFGQVVDTLKWNNTDAYAGGPQKRYSIFASGNYDVTDDINFFARGTWSESRSKTRLFPANASFGWEAFIPYNPTTDSPVDPTIDETNAAEVEAALAGLRPNPGFIPTGTTGAQHPVSPEFALLLNSRAAPSPYCLSPCGGPGLTPTPNPALVGTLVPNTGNRAGWVLETYPLNSFDARSTENTNSMWQLDAGLTFGLPFGDWSGDVLASHGEYNTYNNAFGNNSLTRWRLLVTQPDYGRNVTLESNQPGTSPTPPQSVGFGGAVINCTTGFYDMIFAGDARPSENCLTAVNATLQTRTQNQQNIYEVNAQGGLFDLPAGQVRAAVGFQFRENRAQFIPDILQSTSSFADQVVGVYPTGYLDARMLTRDTYGELLVPVLRDVPGVQSLELELGGRYSNYSATDSTFTYKIAGSLQFNDMLRLRGGFNKATRAPNLGELFLNVQEIFTIGGNFGDPCGLRSNAPYSAAGANDPVTGTPVLDPVVSGTETPIPQLAPGQTQAGADSAYLVCQALMGTTGTTAFYAQNQTAPGAGGGFTWVLQQGNRDLTSEKADTWTAGLVFSSRSERPWLAGFTGAIDWWKVSISDAIQQYSTDYASYLCYGAVQVTDATEAAAQAQSRACQNVARNRSTGGQTTTLLEYDNQSTIETSGIDLQLNWGASLGDVGFASAPGRVGLNMLASWTDYYRTKQSPLAFDVETDWVGSLGPNLTGTNPGAYKYRLNTSLFYGIDRLNFALRWRMLPSVWGAGKASEDAIKANNRRVADGGEGIILGYTPGTTRKVSAYSAFDLSMNWDLSESLSLRAGVDNLFDIKPKITGATDGRPYNPDLSRADNLAALAAVCTGPGEVEGCRNPTAFSLASSGAGSTSAGFYDTLGRRYFLGVKLRL